MAKRAVVVGVSLSAAEVADLDRRRGSLTRSAYVRWVYLRSRKGVDSPLPVVRPPGDTP